MSLCSLLFGMDTGQCGTCTNVSRAVGFLEGTYRRQCMDLRSAGPPDSTCAASDEWSSLCTVFFHVPGGPATQGGKE